MSFLKSMWKANNSRHKKLCEEWALATSLRDLGDLPDTIEEEESETFAVKHLGDTAVQTANSTEATSEAVKSVIAAAKAASGNKLPRVNLTVSPKGIEIIDRSSSETLQQISIYRISYCSADATHSNVFAFISSPSVTSSSSSHCGSGSDSGAEDSDPSTSTAGFPTPATDGPLTCHVFLCSKRKMAQSISLTVAKSFERAFEIWKSISHRRMISATRDRPRFDASPSPRPDVLSREDEVATLEDDEDEEKVMNLLIDLNADLTDIRKSKTYLQNTWVSFEETEHLMTNLQKNAICL